MGSPGDKHKYLGLSHGRTRYLDAGAGFAPGADAWLANIGGLAAGTSGGAGFRVLAPHFPGWGPGGQLELGYSFAYLADFVREFQDTLELERSHIVSHSMGGWVAAEAGEGGQQRC